MGRKPAWYLERQLQEAQARENYYKNYVPPESGAVQQRDKTTAYYRSLNIKAGTEHIAFKIEVGTTSLTAIGGVAACGLLANPEADTAPLPARNNVKPSRITWYAGKATPTVGRTEWNTRKVTYYDKVGDQSHFSVPVSKATGAFTSQDLISTFNGLFGASGSKRSLLGAKNGRAWIDLEEFTISSGS